MNAFDIYVRAGDALVDRDVYPHPSRAEAEALLRRNASALALLRQGLAFRYRHPPIRTVDQTFPHFARFRNLARLLSIEAEVKSWRGDWNGAFDCVLDGLHFGMDIPRGAILLGFLVGGACQAIARRNAWDILPHLNEPQCRVALVRLEALIAGAPQYAETLHEEHLMYQAILTAAIRDPQRRRSLENEQQLLKNFNWDDVDWNKWRRRFREFQQSCDCDGKRQEWIEPSPEQWAERQRKHVAYMQQQHQERLEKLQKLLQLTEHQVLQAMSSRFQALIATMRTPLAQVKPLSPSDILLEVDMNVFGGTTGHDRTRLNADLNVAQNALLLTQLALHAYRLETGALPATLDQLVPDFLRDVPADPFALAAPLLYRQNQDGSTLYSVGPDGRDDKGTPIRGDDSHPHRIELTSQGDLVAGINKG